MVRQRENVDDVLDPLIEKRGLSRGVRSRGCRATAHEPHTWRCTGGRNQVDSGCTGLRARLPSDGAIPNIIQTPPDGHARISRCSV